MHSLTVTFYLLSELVIEWFLPTYNNNAYYYCNKYYTCQQPSKAYLAPSVKSTMKLFRENS